MKQLATTFCISLFAVACASGGAGGGEPVLAPGTHPADYAGQRVSIEGVISHAISAHPMSPPLHLQAVNYVEFGSRQIVVYTRAPIECKGRVRLTGTFSEVRARIGPSRSRGGGYRGWHFAAEEHRCL